MERIPREARQLAVDAVNLARSEGCTCVPDVEVSPTGNVDAPWSPLIRHDESCPLIVKLQAQAN